MKNILTLTLLILLSFQTYAQKESSINNPPVNVESLFAHNGINFQTTINKQLRDLPKLGFFSVTSLISDWETTDLTDFMNQSAITYSLLSNFKILGGYHYTENTGFRPSAGFQYSFASEDWLVILYPRVDLSTNSNQENYVAINYTPKINDKFNLYTRLQGLYTFQLKNGKHQRSYVLARVGLTSGDYTFGIGGNLDYFGPNSDKVENIGIFGAVDLF